MVKLKMFAIQVDRPSAIFHPGEDISGRVRIDLAEPMIMRGVYLTFVGQADVRWSQTETRSDSRGTTSTMYTFVNEEKYFNQRVCLFGKAYAEHVGEDPTLAAGCHVYPFNFRLPATLPTSFESDFGIIRYYAEAVINKPWKLDHKTKHLFTVISILDLSRLPAASVGEEVEGEKMVCCLCCAQGPIVGRLYVPQKGYVPGEQIKARVEIRNFTNWRVKSFHLALRQTAVYVGLMNGMIYIKAGEREVAEAKGTGVGPRDTRNFDVAIQVPALPPTGLQECSIITIKYILVLFVRMSGPTRKLNVVMDHVLIGTVPIQRAPATTEMAPGSLPSPPGYYDGPPPSYAESDTGRVDVYKLAGQADSSSRIHGDRMWAPSYTYYHYEQDVQTPQQGISNPAYEMPEVTELSPTASQTSQI